MIGEALAGLGAFKSMLDLAQGLKDINDAAIRNGIAIELQEKILSAQMQQAALIQKVGQLEKEMAEMKAWEADKQRYKLTDFGGGTFAYALKPEASNGEPSHRLCANCYQQGVKSILQYSHSSERTDWFDCYACKTRPSFRR